MKTFKSLLFVIILLLGSSLSIVKAPNMLAWFIYTADAYDWDRDGIDDKDYSDGEFEGRMGWYPDRDASPEYYQGYSEGRDEARHEELMLERRKEREGWYD